MDWWRIGWYLLIFLAGTGFYAGIVSKPFGHGRAFRIALSTWLPIFLIIAFVWQPF